jgi:RimJ/RimL family protein N-acetyltransferase
MITGHRVRLRAIEPEDVPSFVAWVNDEEVIAGLLLAYPLSLADEQDWYESVRKREIAERPLAIEVLAGEGWQMVGNIALFHLDWRVRSAEVGILVGDKRFWSQGYGSEAMRLMLRHAFETLNLNRVCLDVYETNPRAIRSYEKVGFVHEGRRRQAMFKNGRYIDVLQMSVLRQEWQP